VADIAEPGARFLDYDEGVLSELAKIYGGGSGLSAVLESLLRPPRRYYFRVNVLKHNPGELLDEMRASGLEVYRDEVFEEALWLPVRGPARLRDPGCRVVVDKRTAESVMMGAHVYAPGVVKLEDCAAPGREVLVVSEHGFPVALGRIAEGARQALRAGRGLVVENVEPLYRVPSLRGTVWWRRGEIYEQSISSMTVARFLSPRPGSFVVDMCAAPGGKTSHVYELIGGRGRVIAVDHSKSKIRRLREEMRRLGHNVEALLLDARRLPAVLGEGKADYVILDPPCSSLGVIPKVYDRKRMRDIEVVARYQRQLLRAGLRLLKPGGVLVYSTCTMTVTENEENITYAVERLSARPLRPPLHRWSFGLGPYGWAARRVHPSVHGATGYFIALLTRVS